MRYTYLVPSLHCIYASTSGHTEYVVDILRQTSLDYARDDSMEMTVQRAELAKAEDLNRGDVLILASSTWNTGNVEGQPNPHMWNLLMDRAKDVALSGKRVALIALGDERYYFTANAAVHLEKFVADHGGKLLCPTLKIVNEPYGQEEKVREWGAELMNVLDS